MDRGMRGEVPRPRVEAPHHAHRPAEGVGVPGEGLSSRRRGLQEQIIERLLVRARDRPQCLRQCKGHEEVRDRQAQRPLLCEPAGGGGMLTRGTMPVCTRMIALLQCAAVGALVEMAAEGLGAALCNGGHRREVAGEQTVVALRPVCGARAPEDVSQLTHGRCPQGMRDLRGGD